MGELDPSLHAKALASLGASQGGKARAQSLTPDERKQIARQAAEARWGNALPRAMHTGQLVIVGKDRQRGEFMAATANVRKVLCYLIGSRTWAS